LLPFLSNFHASYSGVVQLKIRVYLSQFVTRCSKYVPKTNKKAVQMD